MSYIPQVDNRVVERIRELLKEFEQLDESEHEQERKYYAHGRFQLFLHKEEQKLDVPSSQLALFEDEVYGLVGGDKFLIFWQDIKNIIPGFPGTGRDTIVNKIQDIWASYNVVRKGG